MTRSFGPARILGTFLVAAGLLSCGSDSSTDPGDRVERVEITPASPVVEVGGTLQLTATVTFGDGTERTNAAVTWSSSAPGVATVSALGVLTGESEGTANIVATFEGVVSGPAVATVEDPPPPPDPFVSDLLEGGYLGAPYSDRVEVESGSSDLSVVDGSLPDGLVLDGATGTLSGTPTDAGVFYFTLETTNDGETVRRTYALPISTKPREAFNLWLLNIAEETFIPSERVIAAISDAVARWEAVITGDLEDVTFDPDEFDEEDPRTEDARKLNGEFVEDMVVMVDLAPIDGPGSTLGSAGPRFIRVGEAGSPDINTIFGRLRLDTDDLNGLDDGQLFSLVFHEIGHVIGIGTLWRLSSQTGGTDLLSGVDSDDPRYEGPMGNAEFQELDDAPGCTGETKIPIESGVGQGTDLGHWDEQKFDSEIMTGFAEGRLSAQPISEMTIAAVGDLAYSIDTSAGDPYVLPCSIPSAAAGAEDGDALLGEVLLHPFGARLHDGRTIRLLPPLEGGR